MSKLVPPHGGKLIVKLLSNEAQKNEIEKASSLTQVRMSSRETSDLVMIGMGAFSPLEGFMMQDDYEKVVSASGPFQSPSPSPKNKPLKLKSVKKLH